MEFYSQLMLVLGKFQSSVIGKVQYQERIANYPLLTILSSPDILRVYIPSQKISNLKNKIIKINTE